VSYRLFSQFVRAILTGIDGRTLDAPAVPTSFPSQMGALTGLQSLKITGNNQIPGKIPFAVMIIAFSKWLYSYSSWDHPHFLPKLHVFAVSSATEYGSNRLTA
jgi:hypothetical protein